MCARRNDTVTDIKSARRRRTAGRRTHTTTDAPVRGVVVKVDFSPPPPVLSPEVWCVKQAFCLGSLVGASAESAAIHDPAVSDAAAQAYVQRWMDRAPGVVLSALRAGLKPDKGAAAWAMLQDAHRAALAGPAPSPEEGADR